MKAIECLFMALWLGPATVAAQNVMTASPYSMFGLGEVGGSLYGQQAAMGGVAYGMREGMLLNRENPAGLTAIDSCRLLAEASAFARIETSRSDGSSHLACVGNASAFALAGRIAPGWYMAVGITPYSSMGYYFKSDQSLEGSPAEVYTSTFEGSGGFSKATLTQAVRLPRGFSAGVNLSYIFGTLKQTETQSALTASRQIHGASFYADFGLQYTRIVRREMALTLGAVYGYRQRLELDNTVTVTGSNTSDEIKKKSQTQYLPQYAGLGATLRWRKMTYGLDYTFRQQSVLTAGEGRFRFCDTHEVRAGASYQPGGYPSDSYWKRMTYQAGVMAGTTALSVAEHSGTVFRASAGVGWPVWNGRIQTAVFYERMELHGYAWQRSLAGLTVTYTIGEWMYKVKL